MLEENLPKPSTESIRDLQESREWLRVTLSSIGDAVITTDGKGNVTFLNPVAEALTGWTNQQAQGVALQSVFHIINESTRKEVENPALRALREGLVVGLANHTLLVARDGTERPIDDSAAPIRNAKGEIAGTVLVFRDITERKKQENLVKDAFHYCSNILDTQREPFLVLEMDLRIVLGNRAFYQTFQVQPEETVGRFVYDLGNGQWNIPKLRHLLEEVLPQNDAFDSFEVDHEFEGIGHKFMLLNARRVRKPGNHSELLLLAIEDITARRAVDQSLVDSETRYRRLFQAAKDGILILDARTGQITDANDFMAQLLGMETGEFLGKHLWEIGMFKDIEENKESFRELQRNGYIRHDHLPVQNRRGESVEVEFIANVYQEDHKLVAQCNVRDIAERSLLERQIVQQAETIAGESRRKDEFLAMLSHELRNTLAPIRSAVHLLKLHGRSGENIIQKQAREVIERQVTNLTKLISDLLEISRVVSGRIRLNLQTLDLNQVVQHAVETAKPHMEQRKHRFTLNLCSDPAWVNADATRMEEVLVNLLSNAAKYTPDGGHVEVHCEHPAGQNHVTVRVRDNGIGIDEELLPRIFNLFTQADRSLDRAAGGLGIGLNVAQRLMELQGGTIEAVSPPKGQSKGTELIIRLPRGVQPYLPTPRPQVVEETPKPGGLRILIVDDNIDMVMMLSSTLRHRGYTVQSAYNGPDGLKVAQQWLPDVVLLDIGLPGLDGHEVARRLRSDPATAKIRLIAATGYGRETDISKAEKAGFDAHLVKPYEFDDLEKLLVVRP